MLPGAGCETEFRHQRQCNYKWYHPRDTPCCKEAPLACCGSLRTFEAASRLLYGRHPPQRTGGGSVAGELYRTLTGNEAPKIVTEQPFPGKKSQWEGFDRYDFICNARKATVVVPRKVAEGHPWIWRPAFFGAFPSVDKALLEKGFHVVYYDLTHLYGSPRAQRLGTDFYDIMRRYYRLSSKVTLEGFSRGGLFAFNWGAKNPDKVACIYVDAPVCDVFSWPGRHRELWSGLLAEWGLTDEQMNNFKGNPIDNLEPLADAGTLLSVFVVIVTAQSPMKRI